MAVSVPIFKSDPGIKGNKMSCELICSSFLLLKRPLPGIFPEQEIYLPVQAGI